MARKILAIHEFGVMRQIISQHMAAEMGDMELKLADSAQAGLALLQEEEFDAVVCALEMAGMDGMELRETVRRSKLNGSTPFIIISSTETLAQHRRLKEEGVEFYLLGPFSAMELRDIIARAINPRADRAQNRFGVPGATAVMEFPDRTLTAKIINLSHRGMLAELELPETGMDLAGPTRLTLMFLPEYSSEPAAGLVTRLLRINVDSWHPNHRPARIRGAWRLEEIPPAAARSLEGALSMVEREIVAAEATLREQG